MESALSFEIVPAGEHLFTVGEAGTVFYFVKSGTVDLMITNPTGVYVLYESVGEGGFFGEVAPLVSAGRRPCVAIARCACSLMTLQASALNDLLVVYPTIRPGLYKAALQRFVEIANAQGGAKFLSWVHAAGLSPPTLVTRDSWTCNECRESRSQVWCAECEGCYCIDCASFVHSRRRGTYRRHQRFVPLNTCKGAAVWRRRSKRR
jgi:hypothetical protein